MKNPVPACGVNIFGVCRHSRERGNPGNSDDNTLDPRLRGDDVSVKIHTFDSNGNIIKIASADGVSVTEFDYDVLDHVTSKRVKVSDGVFNETKY